ncbi:MAG TPA: SRPBCC family protein [Woeseiaceae bacterium]|nr:SRPBCC family protein [Woeseiaceae bacterium]
MNPNATAHASFTIERRYASEPATVFGAFADEKKKRRWFAEGEGFLVDSYELDFRVGGLERARFRFGPGTPVPEGTESANDSWYCDIRPDERIVLAYVMTVGGARISSSLATFEFIADGEGTRLRYTEQAVFFEGADGPEIRRQGWAALFDALGAELAAE